MLIIVCIFFITIITENYCEETSKKLKEYLGELMVDYYMADD